MAEDNGSKSRPSPLLIAGLALVAAAAFVAVIALTIGNSNSRGDSSTITSSSYAIELELIMDAADADIGAGLINEHDCFACHVLGDGSLSPLFDGIGALAANRRPPLTAAAYLYESIVDPSAFLLEGYSDSMPNTYTESLTHKDIGHIIAYLLTLTE